MGDSFEISLKWKIVMDSSHEIIAHVRKDDGVWVKHTLDNHLDSTASKAKEFADVFGNGDWAELAGYWHDFGKSLPEWQKYIRKETGYDIEAYIETQKGRPNHLGGCHDEILCTFNKYS